MLTETITDKLKIQTGSLSDYKKLSKYHYRDSRLGPFEKIFIVKLNGHIAGVIVYSMAVPYVALRNVATNNYFAGLSRRVLISLVNKNVRTISRVIVEPRFRGLGLATRLVKQTMPLMNVPVVEALAVMGHINPFFEKAGMTAYTAPLSAGCIRMKEAFSLVGIEDEMLIDTDIVQERIKRLSSGGKLFIERELQEFLQNYGKRKNMAPGFKRIQYVLSKLTARPVYYIWFNKSLIEHESTNTQNHKQK